MSCRDYEDRIGRPFVGPAGHLLDRALVAAGIERKAAYVTNVVKHFKYLLRGKKRLHGKVNRAEIKAYLPWLLAELEVVQPRLVVCLGATAAQALIAPDFRVTRRRGEIIEGLPLAPLAMATVHPSALLRGDRQSRDVEIARFVADLHVAAKRLRADG